MSYKSIELNKSVAVAVTHTLSMALMVSHTHTHAHCYNMDVYIAGAQTTWLTTFTANEFLSAVKRATAPELTN